MISFRQPRGETVAVQNMAEATYDMYDVLTVPGVFLRWVYNYLLCVYSNC